jgi:N-sulfoglucosamine sulfohydrolase
MAIACLADRAPWAPCRMISISSRTNSPACEEAVFAARRFGSAFPVDFFFGISMLRKSRCKRLGLSDRFSANPNLPMKLLLFLAALLLAPAMARTAESATARPNIVWIVGEDMGPEMGCYGDSLATTPHLDKLASQGARYTRCFTHTAVCAPSRHGLITGQYPIKTGAMHMRSVLKQPPVTFTKLLRDAGYHVAWPGKTDFNFKEPAEFADSKENWWKKDAVPKQPFFGYANFTVSHESQVRNDGDKFATNTSRLTPQQRHDPARVQLPPFWPDAPEVRRELANYYDLVTAVDYLAGDVLAWLDKHGLAENTIVVFFGDHGRGMARYKRWCYDTGTHVPLIVRWPGKIAPATVRDELVGFVDLPATMLSLGGGVVPKDFDGVVFLGPDGKRPTPERQYVYAHRDYMDETFDRIRSVRDKRWHYLRNFAPELTYAQRNDYMEKGKTMQVWRQWFAEGKLNPVQSLHFAKAKPPEELYDTDADPFEVANLASDPAHAGKLAELRAACDEWLTKTKDKAGMPVEELVQKEIIAPRNPDYAERAKKAQ